MRGYTKTSTNIERILLPGHILEWLETFKTHRATGNPFCKNVEVLASFEHVCEIQKPFVPFRSLVQLKNPFARHS